MQYFGQPFFHQPFVCLKHTNTLHFFLNPPSSVPAASKARDEPNNDGCVCVCWGYWQICICAALFHISSTRAAPLPSTWSPYFSSLKHFTESSAHIEICDCDRLWTTAAANKTTHCPQIVNLKMEKNRHVFRYQDRQIVRAVNPSATTDCTHHLLPSKHILLTLLK